MKKHTLQENYERLFGPIKENWWDKLSDKSKQSYIKKHGSAPNVAKDGKGSEPEDKPVGGDTGKDADFGANIEDHEFEELHSPLEVDDFIEKYDDKLSD